MERVAGIEPAQPAWKAGVLPLNYTRLTRVDRLRLRPNLSFRSMEARRTPFGLMVIRIETLPNQVVEGGGFEPPKLARQIYSLIPLATREPLRKGAHSLDLDPLCQQGWRGNSSLLLTLAN